MYLVVHSPKVQPAKVMRSVYLITYSLADLSIFPDRQSFADAVCEAVLNCEGPKTKVIQWTCCQENHKKQGNQHYHMVIKLNKIKRWLPIWKYLKNKWGVYVHFSNRHSNYYSAWLYTTKEDEDFIQSAGHPWVTQVHPEQWPQVRREQNGDNPSQIFMIPKQIPQVAEKGKRPKKDNNRMTALE